jgi:DNA polymerase-3 subunit epsilon
MKKYLFGLINLVLIFITGGVWLLVLIPYALYKLFINKKSSKLSTENNQTKKFQGPKFAQDSARGSIFSYASTSKGKKLEVPFAVIDLETTGLKAEENRIIEVAIRRIDWNGNFIDEISTLINPEVEDVGPTFIHHITPEMVKDAPTFKEFAPEILNRISGSIVVAHHAAFEDRFLGAELKRMNLRQGFPQAPCIDTLWLSRQVIDLPNYKLPTVLNAFEIEEIDAHTALGDVRMLSKLLPKLLNKTKSLQFSADVYKTIFPKYSGRIKTRVTNLKKGKEGWMANVIRKLPETGESYSNEVITTYTEMLNKFLN